MAKLSEETKEKLEPILEVLADGVTFGLQEAGAPMFAARVASEILLDNAFELLEKAGFGDEVEALTESLTGHADFS